MRAIVARTRSGTETYVVVVISPATHARPVVTNVSHATRALGSSARMASSTASEMASATLSGCPSVTDSEVKRCLSNNLVAGDWWLVIFRPEVLLRRGRARASRGSGVGAAHGG